MKKELSLVFTGDIGFDKYMDHMWEDENLLAPEILAFLHSGDHVIANVEGPLVENIKQEANTGVQQLLHTMDPKAISVLNKMHADIWNICNNHIMDAGPVGIESTLAYAKENNVKTIGAGMDIDEASKPLILEDAGGVGIFSVGYQRGCKPADIDKAGCLNWSDFKIIEKNIKEIKSKCRWCIIVAHAGEEFTSLPTPYTRDRYLKYLQMGADIIVAHHPHVPMNYELVDGKAIFYSLGNFIFDTPYQRAQYNTELGLLIKLKLTEESYSFEPMGLRIDRNTEHLLPAELPRIFENVPEGQYELLAPLAAKMFVSATKRQQIYMNPTEFKDADEAKWEEHFANPKRSGRVPGEALDFFIVLPLAEKEKEKAWQKSYLENVKAYILEQI